MHIGWIGAMAHDDWQLLPLVRAVPNGQDHIPGTRLLSLAERLRLRSAHRKRSRAATRAARRGIGALVLACLLMRAQVLETQFSMMLKDVLVSRKVPLFPRLAGVPPMGQPLHPHST